MPDDDDDLDADEATLSLECPPGKAFSRSASPALDASCYHAGVGIGEGFHHATGTSVDAPGLRLKGVLRPN